MSGAVPENQALKNLSHQLGGPHHQQWGPLLNVSLQHRSWVGHVLRMCPTYHSFRRACQQQEATWRLKTLFQGSVEDIPDAGQHWPRNLLQIGLPSIKSFKRGLNLLRHTVNMKRIYNMLPGGPNSPSHINHPHPSSSGVCSAFIAISAIPTRVEKGNTEKGWWSWCSDMTRYQWQLPHLPLFFL